MFDADFDFTGFESGIGHAVSAIANFSGDPDDIFAAETSCECVDFGVVIGIEDNLSFSVAVTEVDKNQLPPLLAVAVHPAGESNGLPGVFATKFTTGMCSVHRIWIRKSRRDGLVIPSHARQRETPGSE